MRKPMRLIGHAPVYQDHRGRLRVAADSVGGGACPCPPPPVPEPTYDGYAYEDDDLDDEEYGYDDDGYGNVRRGIRRRYRRQRRDDRRDRRRGRQDDRRGRRRGRRDELRRAPESPPPTPPLEEGIPEGWVPTVVGGMASGGANDLVKVVIKPGVRFEASDINFGGSSAGTMVQSITFGDDLAWTASSANGVPVEGLDPDGGLRGMLDGFAVDSGQEISITGTVAAEGGSLKATIFGIKPGGACR